MANRYQRMTDAEGGGVWDLQERRHIRYNDPGWAAYREFISAGGVPLPPDPAGQLPTLAAAKARRKEAVNLDCAARRNAAMAGKSPWEGVSWPLKLWEALELKAGRPSPLLALMPVVAQMLGLDTVPDSVAAAIAAGRGITTAQQVNKVLADAAGALALEIGLDGPRGKHADAILAAADISALLMYDADAGWPAIGG